MYELTAERLKDRILSLIPTNPVILELTNPWDLYGVPGFDCQDLAPSLLQAAWALVEAKREFQAIGR